MENQLAQRKPLRAAVTRTFNQFDSLDLDSEKGRFDARFLSEKIETNWVRLSALHEQIVAATRVEEIENEMLEHETYEELVVSVRCQMKQIAQNNATNITSSSSGNNAKLPKLTMPSFSGDYLRWTEFWETYEVNVHNNRKISDIEKFSYLRGLLKGNAVRVIDGLSLSSA